MLRTLQKMPELKFLLDAMPSLVAYVDSHYRYKYCNKAYADWFKVSPENAIGKSVSEVIGENAFNRVRQYVDKALAGEVVQWEAWVNYDLGPRFVRAHYTPFRNENGEVIGFSALIHDITASKRAEERYRESEERFRQMAENLSDQVLHIMEINPLRTSYISPSYEKVWGRSLESIYENPLSYVEAVHPQDREILEQAFNRQRKGEITDITYRIIKPTGEIRWIHDRTMPFLDSAKKVIRATGMAEDITQRKTAQIEFEKNVDQSPAILWITDQNAQFTYLSKQWYEFTGQTQSQALGLGWLNAIHPDDQEMVEERFLQATDKAKVFSVECRLRTASGKYRWVIDSGNPRFDATGNFIGFAGAVFDIHDRVVLEEKRRESEKRFVTMADTAPVLVWMAGTDKRCYWFNKGWLEWTGRTMDQEVGNGWVKGIHPDDVEKCLKVFNENFDARSEFYLEFRLKHHSGQYRWISDRGIPRFTPDGTFEGFIGGCMDINEARVFQEELHAAKERAEEANRSKTAFLANMSHEIRTPMTAVLGFAEILRNSQISEEERQDAVARIERSGRALLRVIDDVLDISKVEAGKITLEKVRFSPLEVVTEVAGLLRLQAELKGIGLNTHISPDLPETVCTDPNRVRQILTNLVGNAVKFTSSGKVTIEARTEKKDGKDYLVFAISDTGIGISPSDQKKLFHPFGQADDSITRRYGGTGLGLVLSKRLSEKLGGELELLESTVGKGSVFVVRIPAGPFESAYTQSSVQLESPPKAETKKPVSQDLKGSTVLVVDDVADNQLLMRKYLEKAGAYVETASDGEEAINKALNRAYDVVLMDIQMPVVDGIQATKKLRSMGYKKPILALTAHAMREEAQRSLEAGCDEHMTKPITREMLVNHVKSYASKGSNLGLH